MQYIARPKVRKRSKGFRNRMSERQNHRCCYCGVRLNEHPEELPTIEHAEPLSFGGQDTPDNIVIACHYCNMILSMVATAFRNPKMGATRKSRSNLAWRLRLKPHGMWLFTTVLAAFHSTYPNGYNKNLPKKLSVVEHP